MEWNALHNPNEPGWDVSDDANFKAARSRRAIELGANMLALQTCWHVFRRVEGIDISEV